MFCNVVSDLHLEQGSVKLPGGELLIIAGDAGNLAGNIMASRTPAMAVNNQRLANIVGNYDRFFRLETVKYDRVLYVYGNHEYYGGHYERTDELIRSYLAEASPRVEVLNDSAVEIDGTLFVGSTLWTDYQGRNPLHMLASQQVMMDYRMIRTDLGMVTPAYFAQQHDKSLGFIKQCLVQHSTQRTVVITHHAPSWRSVHEVYRGDTYVNSSYVNDLDQLILDNPQIAVWIHGHTHHAFDYEIGSTRVLCNPRGYPREREESGFDILCGFDLA